MRSAAHISTASTYCSLVHSINTFEGGGLMWHEANQTGDATQVFCGCPCLFHVYLFVLLAWRARHNVSQICWDLFSRNWGRKPKRWLKNLLPVGQSIQSDLLTADWGSWLQWRVSHWSREVSAWCMSLPAVSHNAPQCLTKVLPKAVRSGEKDFGWFSLKKATLSTSNKTAAIHPRLRAPGSTWLQDAPCKNSLEISAIQRPGWRRWRVQRWESLKRAVV